MSDPRQPKTLEEMKSGEPFAAQGGELCIRYRASREVTDHGIRHKRLGGWEALHKNGDWRHTDWTPEDYQPPVDVTLFNEAIAALRGVFLLVDSTPGHGTFVVKAGRQFEAVKNVLCKMGEAE